MVSFNGRSKTIGVKTNMKTYQFHAKGYFVNKNKGSSFYLIQNVIKR